MRLGRVRWLVVLGVVAALVLVGSVAWAAQGGKGKPPPPSEYLSIPAAAFQGHMGDSDPYNDGYRFCDAGRYMAPVFLPHGATVVALHYHFWEGSVVEDTGATLVTATGDAESDTTMASCSSSGVPYTSSCSDTTIDNATVDNLSRQYFAGVTLPETCVTMWSYYVVVEYTPGKAR